MNIYAIVGLEKRYRYYQNIKDIHKGITIDDVFKIVAKEFGVTVLQIKGDSRKMEIVSARRATIMAIIYEHGQLSLKTLGFIMGLDHSTIMYHKKIHQNMMDVDVNGNYASMYFNVVEKLSPKKNNQK